MGSKLWFDHREWIVKETAINMGRTRFVDNHEWTVLQTAFKVDCKS